MSALDACARSQFRGLRWAEPIRLGLIAAGIIAALQLWRVVVFEIPNGGDGWAYWRADLVHPYDGNGNELLPYLYSPAFLQAIAPLKAFQFETFNAMWVGLLLAATVALAGPLTFFVLLLPPILQEIEVGNVHILLALAVALGFRSPPAYAFGLLTKVTPGIGLAWFGVRREWRGLGAAVAATAAIALVSFLLAPNLWPQWFVVFGRPSVVGGAAPVPLVVRLPLALAIVVFAARTNRPWLVPIAVTLALPNVWFNGLAIALGTIPLLPWERLPGGFGVVLRPLFDGRPDDESEA